MITLIISRLACKNKNLLYYSNILDQFSLRRKILTKIYSKINAWTALRMMIFDHFEANTDFSRNLIDRLCSEKLINFSFEGVKRSVVSRNTAFFNILFQMNQFLGNGRPFKIRLLQYYEVLKRSIIFDAIFISSLK